MWDQIRNIDYMGNYPFRKKNRFDIFGKLSVYRVDNYLTNIVPSIHQLRQVLTLRRIRALLLLLFLKKTFCSFFMIGHLFDNNGSVLLNIVDNILQYFRVQYFSLKTDKTDL